MPKPIFENESYKITKIPLNYQIKVKIKKPNGEKLIWSDFYSDLDRGLDYAKETAEYFIKKYSGG